MTTPDAVERAVGAALERQIANARRVGPWRWRVPLSDHWLAGARIDGAEGWISIEIPVPGERPDHGWSLLRRNALLPGRARASLGCEGVPALRVEAPLDEGAQVDPLCHDLIEELVAARLASSGGVDTRPAEHLAREVAGDGGGAVRGGAAVPAPAPPAADSDAARGAALVSSCGERGWLAHARESGVVVVDLGVPRGFHQAEIAPPRDRGTRVSVEVMPGSPLAPESRAAIATLLLSAGRTVRLARATVEERPAGDAVGFEVWIAHPPDAEALDQALSALAAACWIGAREVALLADPFVARLYLAMHAPPSRSSMSFPSPDECSTREEVQHEDVVR